MQDIMQVIIMTSEQDIEYEERAEWAWINGLKED